MFGVLGLGLLVWLAVASFIGYVRHQRRVLLGLAIGASLVAFANGLEKVFGPDIRLLSSGIALAGLMVAFVGSLRSDTREQLHRRDLIKLMLFQRLAG